MLIDGENESYNVEFTQNHDLIMKCQFQYRIRKQIIFRLTLLKTLFQLISLIYWIFFLNVCRRFHCMLYSFIMTSYHLFFHYTYLPPTTVKLLFYVLWIHIFPEFMCPHFCILQSYIRILKSRWQKLPRFYGYFHL
jgi:hypothetical protein